MEGISAKRWGWGQRLEEMISRPPSTKGDGNSAAEPKVRRRKKGLNNLSNSSRPRDPSYKMGGGSGGEE